MKQGIPSRRTRGRGNNTRGRQQSNIRNQQMDSNGPAGRLRGTPQQILDRYSALARDASTAGDTVLAENLWQHAEHYTRMLSASQQQQQPNQQQQGGNGQRYGNGNGRDDQYDYDDQDDDSSGSYDSGNGSDDRGNYDRGNDNRNNDNRNNDDRGNDDRGSGQQRRDTPLEPLVLKSDPEPVSQSSASESQSTADPADSEQPDAPAVWTKEDAQKATDEAAGEERPAPRRRRRTRFPRQADGNEGASASDGSDQSGGAKSSNDKSGNDKSGSDKNGNNDSGEGEAAAPAKLTLPDDPSPAALVDLLTREEESKPRRKRTDDNESDS